MRNLRWMFSVIKAAILNRNTFAILAVAIAFYLAFYAWPYHNQLIIEIPTAVVDLDHSEKSRDWIDRIDATPAAKVTLITPSLAEARTAFEKGWVDAFVVLPENFARDTMRGQPTAIEVIGNGAFPVKGRAVGMAVTLMAAEENATLTVSQLVRHGLDPVKAKMLSILPPGFVSQDLFNPISGYGLYTVSIVATIILQAVMLFGTMIVFGQWLSEGRANSFTQTVFDEPKKLFWLIGAFWSVGLFWGLFIEGMGLSLLGIPSLLDPIASCFAIALFTLSIAVLAVMLTLLMGNNHYAAPLCVIASGPCVFLTGLVFPMHDAQFWVEPLTWLIPTTPGANALIAASQEGATLSEITPYLTGLLGQIVVYGYIAWRLLQKRRAKF